MANIKNVTAEQSLKQLMDGNARFVKEKMRHAQEDMATRKFLMRNGQHPIAVIVSCSDSRVPPEVIFDHNLGSLFVIRNAGPVIGNEVIGSIEYAIAHLNTKLILVLGHEKCGAVHEASIHGTKGSDKYVNSILAKILPSVKKVDQHILKPYTQENFEINVVKENIANSVCLIQNVKNISSVEGVKIFGSYYNMQTGRVELLDPNLYLRKTTPESSSTEVEKKKL